MSVRAPLRAILFDAGNTLLRIDYAAIAAALAARGVSRTADELMRAEWRARVRLDADVFAAGEVASTEARTTHSRYLAYMLEGIGVTDPALVDAMDAWRRGHNQPLGLWTTPEPDAAPALTLAREAGLRTGVISNSNGMIKRILEGLDLLRLVDVVLDSHEEGVEKPQREIFERAAQDRDGGDQQDGEQQRPDRRPREHCGEQPAEQRQPRDAGGDGDQPDQHRPRDARPHAGGEAPELAAQVHASSRLTASSTVGAVGQSRGPQQPPGSSSTAPSPARRAPSTSME